MSLLARMGPQSGLGSAQGGSQLRRPRQVRRRCSEHCQDTWRPEGMEATPFRCVGTLDLCMAFRGGWGNPCQRALHPLREALPARAWRRYGLGLGRDPRRICAGCETRRLQRSRSATERRRRSSARVSKQGVLRESRSPVSGSAIPQRERSARLRPTAETELSTDLVREPSFSPRFRSAIFSGLGAACRVAPRRRVITRRSGARSAGSGNSLPCSATRAPRASRLESARHRAPRTAPRRRSRSSGAAS